MGAKQVVAERATGGQTAEIFSGPVAAQCSTPVCSSSRDTEPAPGNLQLRSTEETQPQPTALAQVSGLPHLVRLLDTHVVSTSGWNAKTVYFVLGCDGPSSDWQQCRWGTLKRFSEFRELKDGLGIGDQLTAPFPSEKGLEGQKHATPHAAADWLLGCTAADPHDSNARTCTNSTHLVPIPWDADATACWKWDSGISMWSSAKPIQDIAEELRARRESKPVLLSVCGNVRVAGSKSAMSMTETHLPIWCTNILQLSEGAVQRSLKQFFSVSVSPHIVLKCFRAPVGSCWLMPFCCAVDR